MVGVFVICRFKAQTWYDALVCIAYRRCAVYHVVRRGEFAGTAHDGTNLCPADIQPRCLIVLATVCCARFGAQRPLERVAVLKDTRIIERRRGVALGGTARLTSYMISATHQVSTYVATTRKVMATRT